MSQPSGTPRQMHLKIADHFRAKLSEGVYKPGDRLPAETTLAKSLAVSRGTVRLALRALVDEGRLERIPGKGTFVSSRPDAVADRTPRSKLVGMLVPSLHDKLSTDMISGAEMVLRLRGYSLVFCHTSHDLEIERQQIAQLIDQNVRGIIVFPIALPEETELVSILEKNSVPLVSIDRHIPGSYASTVTSNNFDGAYRATRHLLDLGHKRVACITNLTMASSVSDRMRGYEQAMRDANLLPYAPIPLLGNSTLQAENAPLALTSEELKLVDHMLGVKERPTAAFCINDFIAIGVMRHFLSKGLEIPGDIAMVGFDDIPLAAFAPVPLSSVTQFGSEIGKKAAEVLFTMFDGSPPVDSTIQIPTRLVLRASSGELRGPGAE